jgi:hypothetical protein
MEILWVVLIFVAAVAYIGRTIARGLKKEAASCGCCTGCSGCPLAYKRNHNS